jgi:hypothetical protein
VYLAIGERVEGPIFVAASGKRMNRHQAARVVRRLARHAGIDKTISPHSLRHSSITTALDAGVPLRDVQEAASHADPRTTMRYDRARRSLDRHATYIVATFVAGASRSPSRRNASTGPGKTMRDVTFRPLDLPACLVCTLDTSSSVQSFPEPAPTISNICTPHKCRYA